MSPDDVASPKYNPEIVGHAILMQVVEQHPVRLSVSELALRIISNPDDNREVEIAIHAISDLRRSGLVRYRNDDQVVEPTLAALRAVELFEAC